MSNTVIKVENLSKQYRLGTVGTGTLSHDLNRWWHKIRGKEDPYLKIGESNDRASKGESEYVWALKDINFEVKQGEVLGIIGKNGAGKSTLLKILSKVTGPTTGSIKAKGRIASLLEVGTGFHPELTGRENIYLNGTILGMTKREVDKKLDEIVDFAGVARYLDTPVKRYSSGMTVRLGFAVAAHLEPEILVVDEVLAVGDAEFQKKAIGKMQEVSHQGGRTVLFVSHNMGSIQTLCDRTVIMKYGSISNVGSTIEMIDEYLKDSTTLLKDANSLIGDHLSRRGNGKMRFVDLQIGDGSNEQEPDKDIPISGKIVVQTPVEDAYLSIAIRNPNFSGDRFSPKSFIASSEMVPLPLSELVSGDFFSFQFVIPANSLRTGLYPLYIFLGGKTSNKTIGNNIPYDILDSVAYLNLKSVKSKEILGYDPYNPVGYFTINIINVNVSK